jgi:hypothetical protein
MGMVLLPEFIARDCTVGSMLLPDVMARDCAVQWGAYATTCA